MIAAIIRLCAALVAITAVVQPLSAREGARKSAPVRLSCNAYDDFERRCHCAGAENYFLGYGRKYCQRSLAETGWSAAGTLWRNRTLLCLQRALHDAMPRHRAQRCDCQQIKRFAFETHVRCYTQLPTSICLLPMSDWLIAYRIIDAGDLLSDDGTRQIFAITQTCLGQ
jgi:hypothetical protein